MSCIQALDHLKIDHPIIEEIISKLTSLKASGFNIHFCWLPGHIGIRGNERAYRATKTARRTNMQPCLIPPLDFKPIIRKHITAMWQNTWGESALNKLHKIAPIINEPRTHHLSTHRDQSVFNRCRIGHSRLTHEFLLKGEPPPECIPCNCPLTTKHQSYWSNVLILTTCGRDFTRFPFHRTFLRLLNRKWFYSFWKQLRCTDFYEFFECLTFISFCFVFCFFPQHMTVWSTNMFSPWRWT